MNLQELFDLLLEKRQLTVPGSKEQLESLRVMLGRKLKAYKENLDKYGFLSEELAACVLSRKSGDGEMTFVLAPKRKFAVTYEIVETKE